MGEIMTARPTAIRDPHHRTCAPARHVIPVTVGNSDKCLGFLIFPRQPRGSAAGVKKTEKSAAKRSGARSPVLAALAALALSACATDPYTAALHDIPARATASPAANADALMQTAAHSLAAGDIATASTLYRRAHQAQPEALEPLIGLGQALSALGSPEEVAKAYRAALARDPDRTEARNGLGRALLALDQPSLALPQFEEVLRTDPDSIRGLSGIGTTLDMVGDHREAQRLYRRALELDPGNLGVLNNLGLSLALSGDFGAAIETLRKVAADGAATARHRQNLALVLGVAGRTADAAAVARLDLGEREVQQQLVYYAGLRQRIAAGDTKGVLGGK